MTFGGSDRSRIVVVGSSNTDMVIRGPTLPAPGETVIGGEFLTAAGGKGANQAVAAARAGADVTFIAAVGADALGEASVAGFEAEGIDTRYVKRVDGVASGVAFILVDADGENMISVASGANAHLAPRDLDAAVDAFAGAAAVVLQLETPLATVAHAARLGHEHGATVILNPAPADAGALEGAIAAYVDIWIPNESEAYLLAGRPVDDLAGAEAAAQRLREIGCGRVVITLGAAGALVADPAPVHVPARRVRVIDTVAAGDAFVGALACRLAEGDVLVAAAEWATAAAALAVQRPGAQPSLPTRAEVQDLVDE